LFGRLRIVAAIGAGAVVSGAVLDANLRCPPTRHKRGPGCWNQIANALRSASAAASISARVKDERQSLVHVEPRHYAALRKFGRGRRGNVHAIATAPAATAAEPKIEQAIALHCIENPTTDNGPESHPETDMLVGAHFLSILARFCSAALGFTSFVQQN
jgi:hypothetical protein